MSSEPEAVRVGGGVASSHAALRIHAPNLDPDEVTARLGRAPSLSYRAGDQVSAKLPNTRKAGMWLLESDLDRGHPLEDHIIRLLAQLPHDAAVWMELTHKYTADLYCSIDVAAENAGLHLSVDTLLAVAQRRLSVEFDIYLDAVTSESLSDAAG